MGKEIKTIQNEYPQTVFDVWHELLEKREEVARQTVKVYTNHPHGQIADQEVEILPRERILLSDNESEFWGQPNEVKAIGARVQVRPDDYDPRVNYSGSYRFFCEGDSLKIDSNLNRHLDHT